MMFILQTDYTMQSNYFYLSILLIKFYFRYQKQQVGIKRTLSIFLNFLKFGLFANKNYRYEKNYFITCAFKYF